MQINTKYNVGDDVWFFRSGNKVDNFSEVASGKVVGIMTDTQNDNVFITYILINKSGELFYREEDNIYDDFVLISMVATKDGQISKDDVKKAYELLGKALGLV